MRDRKKLAWKKIAQRAGVPESTAIYLYQRLEQPLGRTTPVRRAIVATLGCAGLRNTELCGLDWPDLVFAHRKIRVVDAKTAAGVREVAMTPRLLEELLAYRSSLDHVVTGAPAFPTARSTRRNKDNLNARVLKPALRRADEMRAARGLPALPPGVSVHTLRRTYVSLMLAAGADLRWVQSQVGHEDAKMTLDVYTQVLQRKDRALYTSVRPPHGGRDSVGHGCENDPESKVRGNPDFLRSQAICPPHCPRKALASQWHHARIAAPTKKPPQIRGSFEWS